MSKDPWRDIKEIPVKELFEAPGNPQTQTSTVFNNLIEDISEDGFDQPINVVARESGGYTVIDGNHRLRALKYLAYEKVPCIVRTDWDEVKAKIKLIRRNLLVGELDKGKFTKYIDDFTDRYKIPADMLPSMMGFENEEAFLAMYNQAREISEEDLERLGGGKVELRLIENLTAVLNQIFSEFGESVPYSYIYFYYGKKLHTLIQSGPIMKKALEAVSAKCLDEKKDINEVLPDIIKKGLEADDD